MTNRKSRAMQKTATREKSMSMKKIWSLAALSMAVAISGSGCVVSRTAESLWAVGTVEYYADFSEIENRAVYESNGEYYMNVKVSGYHPDPKLIGIFAIPLSHFVVHMRPIEGGRSSLWVKISGDAKEYLCAPQKDEQDDENRNIFPFSVEPVLEMKEPPAMAIWHPVIRNLPPIEVTRFCCGDCIQNSQLVYTEKSPGSYGLLPLVVAGFAWDIPATVMMSTYFDFILVPNILIAKAGQSLLGVED